MCGRCSQRVERSLELRESGLSVTLRERIELVQFTKSMGVYSK